MMNITVNKVKKNKHTLVIFAIIAIGFLLRLFTLDNAISFDEFVQTRAVLDANQVGLDKYTEMNPLTTWTRLATTSLFGTEVWVLRATSLLFAVLTGVMLFLLGKEISLLIDRQVFGIIQVS